MPDIADEQANNETHTHTPPKTISNLPPRWSDVIKSCHT